MDTISRENNSMLPVGSIVLGVVALLLGGLALVQASQAKKAINEQMPKIEKIDAIETQAGAAAQSADKANRDLKSVAEQTQSTFTQVSNLLANMQGSITKLEEAAKKPAVAAAKKGGPVVAGPDEYVIKKGDYGAKIAKAQGVSYADLVAVNPGTDLAKVQIGQKIKLPAKK